MFLHFSIFITKIINSNKKNTLIIIFPFQSSPYDAQGMAGALSYHPYGSPGYPYQLNDPAYRKNATRDATTTLKAWLQEHRKNPYPTKGEKIMLAIITKMTLTQVSTWFANARRRLKKENKVTWGARSKDDEDGNIFGSDNEGDAEKNDDEEEIDLESIDIDKIDDNDGDQSNEDEDDKPDGRHRELDSLEKRRAFALQHDAFDKSKNSISSGKEELSDRNSNTIVVSPDRQGSFQLPVNTKPKIWSLAETATSPDSSVKSNSPSGLTGHTPSQMQHPAFLPSHGLYTCQIGKFHNWTNGAFLGQNSLLNVRSFLGVNQHQHHNVHLQTQQQQQQHQASVLVSTGASPQLSPKHIGTHQSESYAQCFIYDYIW